MALPISENIMSDNPQNVAATHAAMPNEMLLEFVQEEDGALVLREVNNKEQVLVTIQFSEQVQQMLGDDTPLVGERMIQAAMAAVMRQQVDKWHAHFYDEEPKFYS